MSALHLMPDPLSLMVQKQEALGWGKSVVEQMAKDLQSEFGKKSGYSTQNLWYMRQFYLTYHDDLNLQQLVGEIPWGYNILIFTKCKSDIEQEYYIKQTKEFGWSRNVLTHHIKTELYQQLNINQSALIKHINKLKEKYQVEVPFWKDSLYECLTKMDEKR